MRSPQRDRMMLDTAPHADQTTARPEGSRNEDVWNAVRSFGHVPALVGLAFLVRFSLEPLLGDRGTYLFFLPAVLFASNFGGFGAGLFATALSAPLGHLFFGPVQRDLLHDLVYAGSFVVVSVSVAWFGGRLRAARIRSLGSE